MREDTAERGQDLVIESARFDRFVCGRLSPFQLHRKGTASDLPIANSNKLAGGDRFDAWTDTLERIPEFLAGSTEPQKHHAGMRSTI